MTEKATYDTQPRLARRPAVTTGFSVVVWPRTPYRACRHLDVLLWRFRFVLTLGSPKQVDK